ncbi:type II toxin-antitoxin system HicB family antitoxin [Wansuia hejianensis]|uniref:Type II toxin-antitoxin system HicB family antitoxin n=1 Tax=Wansuia hejianensis TaxID=2763667 RepID=A0A7G9G8P8_9FIRM|nr:type II toxin-antitoxin system HicB family antitoxin [Wansuia hejianensis]QNM07180.1 type II toxin-antitoxin system HicB family antitoxin [Wansuia hejianensis]
MKAVYPVIFTQTDTVVLVEVPDLEILTEGKDLQDAIEMARDAIGLTGISMQDHGESIPEPSDYHKIKFNEGTFAKDGEGQISLVDIDFDVYRRKVDVKTVRRNVTLPNWLNREAEEAHINVSKVLQEALMAKLGVSR